MHLWCSWRHIMVFSSLIPRTRVGSADGGGVSCISTLGMLSDGGWSKIPLVERLEDNRKRSIQKMIEVEV